MRRVPRSCLLYGHAVPSISCGNQIYPHVRAVRGFEIGETEQALATAQLIDRRLTRTFVCNVLKIARGEDLGHVEIRGAGIQRCSTEIHAETLTPYGHSTILRQVSMRECRNSDHRYFP